MKRLLIIIVALMSALSMMSLTPSNKKVRKKPKEESGWIYKDTKDPMTDEIKWSVCLYSSINTNFTYADLKVNAFPEADSISRVSVSITICKASKVYYSEDDDENYIRVRFDTKPVRKYDLVGLSNDDGDKLFILEKKKVLLDFIENCKSAKKILIEIPLREEGRTIFEFKTDKPLRWK